jgi:hypothetical protein
MKYRLSQHAVDVMRARGIAEGWVEDAIENPSLKVAKAPNELNLFLTIKENENRCLKVVINPISMIVVTAYFDRNMRKRGCK